MTGLGPLIVTARIVGIALVVAVLVGCRDSSLGEGTGALPREPVTFARHVAPIVFSRCAGCHRPGGSAPFSLLEYESARSRARLIAEATQLRIMPPWLPEPGYGDFAGERRLTNDQIETIQRWIDDGMQEGNPADLPAPPVHSEGWQLGEPDLVIKMAQPYSLPAAGTDAWRNFVIPIPVSQTRYVKTVELRPGNARFVHHALMAIDDMGSSRRRDARDPTPGFEGMDMGDAQMPDGSLMGWTPGMLPFPGIEGTAWRLDPGADAVLQLHLLPSGKPEIVEPAIGIYFAPSPATGSPMYVLQLQADEQIDIPAGAADFVVTDAIELPVDVDVFAAYPHAHYLGKRIEAWATLPDGTTRWLIRIDRWDFKWQDIYRYVRPVPLPRGTTVTMRWTYDNSSANPRQVNQPPQRVRAGDRSSQEMAHLMLQLRLQRPGDLALLKETHYRHLAGKEPHNARLRYGLAGALKDQGRFAEAAGEYRAALARQPSHVSAHINLGAVLLTQGHADEAVGHFRTAVKLDPDSAGAHYNLAFALGFQGRLDDAARHYRAALARQPDFAEAHNNLGQVLQAQGRLDEAIGHFRDAVRLLPDSADVHNNLGAGLRSKGSLEEAISHFRRALALEPGHTEARENLNATLKARQELF